MTVVVHLIVITCFKFLFVDGLGPTATLNIVKPPYSEHLLLEDTCCTNGFI